MATYAEIGDLVNRWRPLGPDELPRAQVLLEQASRLVRLRVPGVDGRLVAGSLDPALVADVVCAMVARVLAAGVSGGEAVTQKSVTVGGITTSTQYSTAASGSLTLEDGELSLLVGSRKRAFSVDLTPVSTGRYWDAS